MPEKGKIVGCERQAQFADIAHRYWQQAGIAHKVELMLQPAQDTLLALLKTEPFDLIYIDADKANYPQYYEVALQLTPPGGVIALDNMLSGGRVIELCSAASPNVHIIHQLNQFIREDDRVEMIMLPIADGLTLVRKK
jgi:caffeoyl-CoA O-methyltransferase